jgi:hypothetical protein
VREALTPAHDTRRQWEVMTEPARRMAQAADLELKRRGLLSRLYSGAFTSCVPSASISANRDTAAIAAMSSSC